MEITNIAYDSPEYRKMTNFRYEILRKPLGLTFSESDLRKEKDDVFITCCEEEKIIGCCILTKQNSNVVKLRQMAVLPERQGEGLGKKIVSFAEQYAMKNGYLNIVLHARETAAGFYLKCSYSQVGETFIEIGIPHVLMEKKM